MFKILYSQTNGECLQSYETKLLSKCEKLKTEIGAEGVFTNIDLLAETNPFQYMNHTVSPE